MNHLENFTYGYAFFHDFLVTLCQVFANSISILTADRYYIIYAIKFSVLSFTITTSLCHHGYREETSERDYSRQNCLKDHLACCFTISWSIQLCVVTCSRGKVVEPADVFIGYHADTAASVVLQACERVGGHLSLGDWQEAVSMDK